MNALPVRRWFNDYGMVIVLLGLCGYFALVTNTTHEPVGTAAAQQVARKITAPRASVMLIARQTGDDSIFLGALEAELRRRGLVVVSRVQGEPRDARLALEQLVARGEPLTYIATTADCGSWTLLQNVRTRFPALGQPQVLVPESYRWPAFLTRQNLLNVANQIAVVAIIAAGMTIVIITGGIDLSVGSLVALSAVVCTALVRDLGGGVQATPGMIAAAAGAAVGLCAGLGLFTATMIAGFRVPPFIATLAMMQVGSGLAFIVAKGGSIYELPDRFTWLGRGTGWFGIPHAVWLMIGLYLAAHWLMSRTVLGRQIYAVGGNAEAARLSGVRVPLVLLFAYAFCGAMAGLGGIVQASQLKSGAPTYGQMYELYAIAAVVVGGTSLAGGEGRVFGTLIGALIIAVIQNGMNLTGVESYRQKIVLGFVILAGVLLDLLKQRDWRSGLRRILKRPK